MYHEPVLLKESVDALMIQPDGVYVDVTFGGGGHSGEILSRLGPSGRLLAFDQDADAARNVPDDKRFVLIRHNYRYLWNFLRYYGVIPVQGILADLGISSHQVDEAERGFSLRFDAELDMRMNRKSELTAATLLNTYPEENLVHIFSSFGEVHNSKTLARKIVLARKEKELNTVADLKSILLTCTEKQHETQYMAKVFQALRIEVNDELTAIREFLVQSGQVLSKGGRLVVIAYHSLEDRLVKNFFLKGKFEGDAEKDFYGHPLQLPFKAVNRKPLEAGPEETERNPRARSAKLRVAERL